MPNKKLAKPSMLLRSEVKAPNHMLAKAVRPISASQLAEEFCHEMIDNLRHNVAEQKKRLGHKF